MLAEILSMITVGIVISHLILDILKERRIKNIDQQKLQLEQGKAGLEIISKIPEIFKSLLGASLDDPEDLKKKLKKFQENYKDFKLDDSEK